jgi:hypothetical protein
MRTRLVAGLVLAFGATAIGAYSRPAQSTAAPIDADRPLPMIGCVAVDNAAGTLAVSESTRRIKYRVKATSLQPNRVQGLRIVGAFIPTTNLAAQAGSIDPTFAAMAMAGAIPHGTGATRTELQIRRVPSITGSCPPR